MFKKLRKLYGRSPRGKRGREYINLSITSDTMSLVRTYIAWKRGGDGSAAFELAIRLLLVMTAGDNDSIVNMAKEISASVEDTNRMANNLEMLVKLLRA